MPDWKNGIQTKHEILVKPDPEMLAHMKQLTTGQAVGGGIVIGLLIAILFHVVRGK